ncbi:MAG: flagellar basal body P-ring formation chaperone FlgA [Spongiibacteraceae bacterium]
MIVRSFLLLYSVVFTLSSPLATASVTSSDIKASVSLFMDGYIQQLQESYGDEVRIEYHIRSLDPRLAMADCPHKPISELKSPNSIGNINIRVSCQQGQPWSLFVPVSVDLFRPIVVTTLPTAKGSTLTASQLELREMDVSQINGSYFTRIEDVTGNQASRPLNADSVIVAGYIEPPLLVKRGESVMITAKSGGLLVKISGTALADGHLGEQIRVRNNQSKRIVDAVVDALGQVVIPL